jgi:CRP-like cAMP-binding protein
MQRMETLEFQNYLQSRAPLGEMDLERICSLATPKVLRRNEFMFHEGEVCRYKAFIVKGLLQTFSTSPDGSEHILQFSPEHTWIVDAESYDKQTPGEREARCCLV